MITLPPPIEVSLCCRFHRALAVGLIATLPAIAPLGAAPSDGGVKALAETGAMTVEGGAVAIGSWRNLGRFPALRETAFDAAAADKSEGRVRFGKGFASVSFSENKLKLHTRGRTEEEKLGWAPMLVFTPSAEGHFQISGDLEFSGVAGREKAMRWAVLKFPAGAPADAQPLVIVDGRGRNGGKVNLASQTGYLGERLSALPLKAGDRVALTVWYSKDFDGGGAQLAGFGVKPVAAPPAEPTPQPIARPAPSASDLAYPPTECQVDVTKAPYFAKGDGVTDDTEAIQRAMNDHNRGTVFLPNGTYLVSRQLRWSTRRGERISHLLLRGESAERTILKLRDNCPGFRDVDEDPDDGSALAVLRTESDSGPPDAAIENFILNLTVDTGKGNPGAIGVSFLANNVGAMRNVIVRSGDGQGLVGIACTRIPGPCLIKDVKIEGFQYGLKMKESLYNVVVDGLEISGQSVAGIHNPAGMLTIHNLTSRNSVPAVINDLPRQRPAKEGEEPVPPRRTGMTQIINAKLEGGDPSKPAMISRSYFYARNVTSSGYATVLEAEGFKEKASSLTEFSSDAAIQLFRHDSAVPMLELKPTPPDFHTNDFSQWANVESFAHLLHYLKDPAPDPATTKPLAATQAPLKSHPVHGQVDHTNAIQAALDSGKPIVYFPRGDYSVTRPLRVPPTVRRLVGLRSRINALDGTDDAWGARGSERPVFHIEGKAEHPLTMEFFLIDGNAPGERLSSVSVLHDSPRALVIKHSVFSRYRNSPGCGPLFVEDVCGTGWWMDHPQDANFLQVNPEGTILRLSNNGGRLFVLGLKTEGGDTVIRTVGGGQTEMIGAFLRPSAGNPMNAPAFIVEDSTARVIACGMTWSQKTGPRLDRSYHYWVRETQGGVTRELTRADIEAKGFTARDDVILPLFTALPAVGSKPKSAPMVRSREGLPEGFRLEDIGHPGNAAEARFYSGGVSAQVTGRGYFSAGKESRRIIGTAKDACALAWHELPDNGSISATLLSLRQRNGLHLKAGLMLRQTADAGSPALFWGVDVQPSKAKSGRRLVLLSRTEPGKLMAALDTHEYSIPLHLRLRRNGDAVIASWSPDGTTWTDAKPATFPAGKALAGMAVSAEDGIQAATATFSNIEVKGTGGEALFAPVRPLPAPWLATDLAPTQPGKGAIHQGRSSFKDGQFEITGSGWLYHDTRDYGHFVHQWVHPGTQVVARVRFKDGELPPLSAAGIAFRESPAEEGNDRAFLLLKPGKIFWHRRIQLYGEPGPVVAELPAATREAWLKFAWKDGGLFGYTSEDGKTWKLHASAMSSRLPPGAALGLFATSGDLNREASAMFDQVSVGPAEVPDADMAALIEAVEAKRAKRAKK